MGFREAAALADQRDRYAQKLASRASSFKYVGADEDKIRETIKSYTASLQDAIYSATEALDEDTEQTYKVRSAIEEAHRVLGVEITARIPYIAEDRQADARKWVAEVQSALTEFEKNYVFGNDAAAKAVLVINFWPNCFDAKR
jgi:predicted GNAT superfamily acetyltransferase